MKPSKLVLPFIRPRLAGLLALSFGCSLLHATSTEVMAPVGYVSLPANANSDTLISLPLSRASAYAGTVAQISGTIFSVSDSPGWTTNQFAKSLPAQPDAYYVQFKTGGAAGHFFSVGANTASTMTIDWNNEPPVAAAGDQFELIAFWTLGTLFPAAEAGKSFTATTNVALHNTELQMLDPKYTGINLPVASTYYFYNGAWRKTGQPVTVSFDGTPLPPDTFFRIRNKAAPSTLTIAGAVNTGPLAVLVNAQGGSAKQDNAVALRFAGTVTLGQSNLVASGAFQPTTIAALHKDELLIFDNTATGYNKPVLATYYFFNNGWRKTGSPTTTDFSSDAVFAPGTGVILRKAGTGGSAQTLFWNYTVSGL